MGQNHVINSRFIKIALLFFVIAAFYGLLMRINFYEPVQNFIHQRYMQAHSHVAFLGWGFLATTAAMIYGFLPKAEQGKKVYKISFWIMIATCVGMLVSFPLQGYKAFSIALLSVFGIASYVFSFHFLRDAKKSKSSQISIKFAKAAIYFYLISNIAIWVLGPIVVVYGKTDLYFNTVYFYLHFLYNGFFVFALFGLFFKYLDQKNIEYLKSGANKFYLLNVIACIPAYLLSVLWSEDHSLFYLIGFAAALLQVVSLFFLFTVLKKSVLKLSLSKIERLLYVVAFSCYFIKVGMQLITAHPYVVLKTLQLKSYLIIGYIHLFTLGFMSVLLLFVLIQFKKIEISKVFGKLGILLFVVGVIVTEIVLFLQAGLLEFFKKGIVNYDVWMLISSSFIFAGLLFVLITQFKKRLMV